METVNQEKAAENTEKTFTQAELNAIVTERLKREGQKYADYESLKEKAEKFDQMEEANKSELQKAIERSESLQNELDSIKKANTIREIRESVAKETGVPADLLTEATEDACKKQAKAILEFSTPKGYPAIRDGGEITKKVGKRSTSDQFAEWAEQFF